MIFLKKLAVLALTFGVVGVFSAETGDVVVEDGTILGDYGPIVVKMVNGKKTALVDSSKLTLDIPEDVEVEAITYNRDYSADWGKPGTLILPFDLPNGCITGAQIYDMVGIDIAGTNTWQIDTKEMGSNGVFKANRPYFVRPYAKNLTFQEWCSATTMKSTRNIDTKVVFDNWEFTGVYSYKKWEEGDSDLGYIYGFAAKEKVVDGKTIQEGQFVKGKAGASVRPFRAFLKYNKNATALTKRASYAPAATASLTADDLPSTIDVIFHDEDGETTAIHSLDPRTGEFTVNKTGWYDLSGRKLGKKPTVKGSYFYNGKKVIIK